MKVVDYGLYFTVDLENKEDVDKFNTLNALTEHYFYTVGRVPLLGLSYDKEAWGSLYNLLEGCCEIKQPSFLKYRRRK